jgi:squalene-associated FAD-dependent desaturase
VPAGTPHSVAVIGGGWAGCAAAVTLAQAGVRVTLFEQARILGGRARRVGLDGVAVDNGQHLLIGAYRQTLDLIATVHGADRGSAMFRRLPLTLTPFGRRRSAVSFAAWRAPTPFHLLGGFLTARGLSWRERWSLIDGYRAVERADFRCPPTQSVAECFAATPRRAMDALWSPLCLAALNTPAERASAQIFANVLRAAFAGRAANSHFLYTDDRSFRALSRCRHALHRGAWRHRPHRCGGAQRCVPGTRRHRRHPCEPRALCRRDHRRRTASASPPPSIARTVAQHHGAACWTTWPGSDYESITTIYVAYATPVALPSPLARLDDAPGQWVFDRSTALPPHRAGAAKALLAVVISGNGTHDALDHALLAGSIDAQLRRLAPQMSPLLWSRVIAERRATYACTPGLRRPPHGRIAAGLYLAGDYTDADFPATLEAATRSGVAAAASAAWRFSNAGAVLASGSRRLRGQPRAISAARAAARNTYF